MISIIIPVFNAAKTLRACLASIEVQTYRDYEIIAVNDGSTDGSLAILQNYDKRITVIDQDNHGAPAARNAGVAYTRGEYILFCDADITLSKLALEKMQASLTAHPEVAYVYSDFRFGWKTFRVPNFDGELLKQMPYIHTTSLIRKSDFPGFDVALKRFQDWDLWLTLLAQGKTGLHIPEILFKVRSGGTMSSWLPSFVIKSPLFKNIAGVKKYDDAKAIIKQKHRL